MTRQRAGIVVAVVLVLALMGLGIWRRQQLMAERDTARTARRHALEHLARTRIELMRTSREAGAIESASIDARAEADDLRRIADDVAAQVTVVTRERDDAMLAAYFATGQVGTLRTCLDGINRALNQVSVGDPNSVRTLETVRTACRAVS